MTLLAPPEAPRTAPAATPLVAALAQRPGAQWVEPASIDAFLAQPGDAVLLFSGDAVRFPEGQDVAVVLPELLAQFPDRRVRIGVVPVACEDALAARFGSQRWPALVFLRDGGWLGTVTGMHDWLPFVDEVRGVLAAQPRRAPGVGIAVVNGHAAAASGCH